MATSKIPWMSKGEEGVQNQFKGINLLNSPESLKQLWGPLRDPRSPPGRALVGSLKLYTYLCLVTKQYLNLTFKTCIVHNFSSSLLWNIIRCLMEDRLKYQCPFFCLYVPLSSQGNKNTVNHSTKLLYQARESSQAGLNETGNREPQQRLNNSNFLQILKWYWYTPTSIRLSVYTYKTRLTVTQLESNVDKYIKLLLGKTRGCSTNSIVII